MKIINLREYYPFYNADVFLEVSDEVASILEDDKRRQINYEQYIRDNKAFYSLDAGDGIEASALHKPEQPDEAMLRQERDEFLYAAWASLSKKQRQRIYAHVVMGVQQAEIAKKEGVCKSTVSESISSGLKKLREVLKNVCNDPNFWPIFL